MTKGIEMVTTFIVLLLFFGLIACALLVQDARMARDKRQIGAALKQRGDTLLGVSHHYVGRGHIAVHQYTVKYITATKQRRVARCQIDSNAVVWHYDQLDFDPIPLPIPVEKTPPPVAIVEESEPLSSKEQIISNLVEENNRLRWELQQLRIAQRQRASTDEG